jgi:formate dehydrogenase subunit gamma
MVMVRMKEAKKMSSTKTVKRFSKWVIFAHWANAISFLALYVTGLPLYTDFFSWMFSVISPENLRLLHRIFAVIFIATPIIILIFDPKSMFHWLKQLVSWKKRDIQFLMRFAKEFFGGHVDMPKQGFYNAGEKVNSILQILCFLALVGSGIVIWMPHLFSQGVVQWAYPIHNIGFGLAAAVVIGHIYLSIGHPGSKGAMQGITKGDVPVEFAKSHYEEWYDELVAKGEIKEEKPARKGKGA